MSAIPAPPALTGGDRSRFAGLEKPRARRPEGPQAGGLACQPRQVQEH